MGLKQDIDFTDSSSSVGLVFLYIFYGMYDALWQGYWYWIMGATSNSAAVAAILVASYKTFQSMGGAMAWRVNALNIPAMTQLRMNWGLTIGNLVIAMPMVWTVTTTSTHSEKTMADQKTDFGVNAINEEAKTGLT
jgi:hypothetical protein